MSLTGSKLHTHGKCLKQRNLIKSYSETFYLDQEEKLLALPPAFLVISKLKFLDLKIYVNCDMIYLLYSPDKYLPLTQKSSLFEEFLDRFMEDIVFVEKYVKRQFNPKKYNLFTYHRLISLNEDARRFFRVVMIHVEDFQMRIKIYQKRINLTPPMLSYPCVQRAMIWMCFEKPNLGLCLVYVMLDQVNYEQLEMAKEQQAMLSKVVKAIKERLELRDSWKCME
ncbi:hypothetical protein Tco_0574019 [Tanacetum coccineum]